MELSECMLRNFFERLLDASVHTDMPRPILRKARQKVMSAPDAKILANVLVMSCHF